MRLRRCLCLVLLCAVICCGLFSVSTYAAVFEQYTYNGVVLPKLPDFKNVDNSIFVIGLRNEIYYLYECSSVSNVDYAGLLTIVVNETEFLYKLSNNEWVKSNLTATGIQPVWSNNTIYLPNGEVYLSGSEPVITLIEILDPPIGTTELNPVLNAYIDQLNVPLLVGVLAGAAGVSVGLVFLWWGARKVKAAFMKAFKSGKLRI